MLHTHTLTTTGKAKQAGKSREKGERKSAMRNVWAGGRTILSPAADKKSDRRRKAFEIYLNTDS